MPKRVLVCNQQLERRVNRLDRHGDWNDRNIFKSRQRALQNTTTDIQLYYTYLPRKESQWPISKAYPRIVTVSVGDDVTVCAANKTEWQTADCCRHNRGQVLLLGSGLSVMASNKVPPWSKVKRKALGKASLHILQICRWQPGRSLRNTNWLP